MVLVVVQAYMPTVLERLSEHVRDPLPIGTGARLVFADFMRTHKVRVRVRFGSRNARFSFVRCFVHRTHGTS